MLLQITVPWLWSLFGHLNLNIANNCGEIIRQFRNIRMSIRLWVRRAGEYRVEGRISIEFDYQEAFYASLINSALTLECVLALKNQANMNTLTNYALLIEAQLWTIVEKSSVTLGILGCQEDFQESRTVQSRRRNKHRSRLAASLLYNSSWCFTGCRNSSGWRCQTSLHLWKMWRRRIDHSANCNTIAMAAELLIATARAMDSGRSLYITNT